MPLEAIRGVLSKSLLQGLHKSCSGLEPGTVYYKCSSELWGVHDVSSLQCTGRSEVQFHLHAQTSSKVGVKLSVNIELRPDGLAGLAGVTSRSRCDRKGKLHLIRVSELSMRQTLDFCAGQGTVRQAVQSETG